MRRWPPPSPSDVGAGAEITTVPLLLAGPGDTVTLPSWEPQPGLHDQPRRGVGALTSSFLPGIEQNPAVPNEVTRAATVELAAGAPFISDADLNAALDDAGVPDATAEAILDENEEARLVALRAALAVLALAALAGLFFTRRLPTEQATSS